jgi:Fe-S cluster assembly protein SufD
VAQPSIFEPLFEATLARAQERNEPAWLLEQRQSGFARFVADGLPTVRDEMWKYTNVQPLVDGGFTLPENDTISAGDPVPEPRDDERQIVFINGALSMSRSQFGDEDGVSIQPIFDVLGNGGAETLKPLIQRAPSQSAGVFGALHSAFLSNGVVIRIEANADVTKRIHVLCLQTRVSPGLLSAPRIVINAGASSRATVVQSHIGVPEAAGFTNAATDIHVGQNAELSYCKVQSEGAETYHFSHLHAEQERDSRLSLFEFSMGGRLVRNNVYVRSGGENTNTIMNGVYALRGKQHVDNHTTMDHAKPNCNSHQIYKGILDEQARGVFDGRIIVRVGATKTDAIQLNRNLLLSRRAHVDTKPQLEISNDDVKCTHGATIGQLDQDELFYLESRGISPTEAVAMLSRAFAEEVLFEVSDTVLRESLRDVLGTFFENSDKTS